MQANYLHPAEYVQADCVWCRKKYLSPHRRVGGAGREKPPCAPCRGHFAFPARDGAKQNDSPNCKLGRLLARARVEIRLGAGASVILSRGGIPQWAPSAICQMAALAAAGPVYRLAGRCFGTRRFLPAGGPAFFQVIARQVTAGGTRLHSAAGRAVSFS